MFSTVWPANVSGSDGNPADTRAVVLMLSREVNLVSQPKCVDI